MPIILLVFAIVLLALNGYVSLRTIRDELSLRRECVAQLFLIWLFPCAGALLVLNMLRQSPEAPVEGDADDAGRAWDCDDYDASAGAMVGDATYVDFGGGGH